MADEMQQDEFKQELDGQNGSEEQAEQPVTESQQNAGDDDEDEDDKKLFVGGLSWETTTKDLREYFEKFGEVTNCTLKTDLETKKSRGFGFVTFASVDVCEKILAEAEHKLHGRTIDPKKANPRPTNKKVFVGRLDPGVTEEEVRKYFETFGPVEKLELPFDKNREQRRAFCFVEFKRSSSMKKCLDTSNHKVGNQEVEVKKATPPGTNMAMRGAPRGRGGFGPSNRGFQGGYPSYGNYGGYNQNYGYGGYDQGYGGYGYSGYDGYGGYGSGYGGWNNGGYDQNYGYGSYGGYEDWAYGQGGDFY